MTVDTARFDRIVGCVVAWARQRPDVLGLALAGSRARGTARPDSDIDLVFLVPKPQEFRRDARWLHEINWAEAQPVHWDDADYGAAWSRHIRLQPACEVEFTFCEPSSAAIDPVDPGTAAVVSNGWRVLLDKAGRFENLALAIPR